jgi:hypothetical protein
MSKFRFYNRLLGWIVFLISAIVYLMTIEPTTSLWDCGEFIASAFKLQVGHPPGAPLFMIVARFFSLFAGSDVTKVALMVNALSGIVSALTIMFLFWTISHLGMKILKIGDQIKSWQIISILGSSLTGALAYTFSDTFWFSAVEGEVYASSSLFTAVVFWAILKWENEADDKYANRWLILIAYLMGLSIGVHLLNLLAIPAIVLVFYFRKFTYSRNGLIAAISLSFVLLAGIMYIIIPGVIWLASRFELIFVNGFALPYKSGVLVYAVLLIGGLIYGILYTLKKNKIIANTIITGITVIILGYSSFSMIVIRSMANPPMDENSPETVFSLMYYLNREQYGDRPLFSGQYFNAPRPETSEGKPTYTQIDGRYKITNRKVETTYDKDYTTIFPRMYSSQPEHIRVYMEWANLKERDLYNPRLDEEGKIIYNNAGGVVYDRSNPKRKPGFGSNLRFFMTYQLGHMYFRYFMWNFAGRQNDEQGHGDPLNGNWISGINIVDKAFTGGDLKIMPDDVKNHAARNTYYFLPFLLGIFGAMYHAKKQARDFSIVAVLFFMTGIAIVLYLNQTPIQPRERDYAYAGSFYAFAIWIGLGIMALADMFGRKMQNAAGVTAITAVSLLAVPGIMARENWDDHDRSGRYTARDIAYNYLNSCAPNAILFTGGDNDTFPLWYAQDVEGIRTDVRVVNLMLLNMDWYIDQMKVKAYESEPLPITMENSHYINGTRDIVHIVEQFKQSYPATDILEFIVSDQKRTKLPVQYGENLDYVPTRNFYIPVDSAKVLHNGTVNPKDAEKIVPRIEGRLSGGYITKSNLAALDLLANNNWERPVYFVGSNHTDDLGLSDYLQLDGLAYKLVPIQTKTGSSFERGRIDSEILYNKLMNEFKYGRMNEPDVYLDNFHLRTLSVIRLRYRFMRAANQLAAEGDTARAIEVLDRIMELTPHENVSYHIFVPGIAESYYQLHQFEKGTEILHKMVMNSDQFLNYYFSFKKRFRDNLSDEIDFYLRILGNTMQIAQEYGQTDLATEAQEIYIKHSEKYAALN